MKFSKESFNDYKNSKKLKVSYIRSLRDWFEGKIHRKL